MRYVAAVAEEQPDAFTNEVRATFRTGDSGGGRAPTLGVAGVTPSDREQIARSGRALTPMGRLGTAAEVARAAIFLALEATFTTGAELQVDGGLTGIDVPG